MRVLFIVATLSLALASLDARRTADADAPTAAAPNPPTPPTPATPAAADDAGAAAAAAHAKRTACRKEAKTKKLVGADKTAFMKSCLEAK
jgi:hypothetical protein